MKYTSIDKPSDFEFHDSLFDFDSFTNGRLIVKVKYLNIHKDAEQNLFETDMEIECANITFGGFNIISYELGRAWERDENGNMYTNEPQVIFEGDEAWERFLQQLKFGTTVYWFGAKENGTYYMDACASDPFFIVLFTFDKVVFEWNEYKKEAWYVKK